MDLIILCAGKTGPTPSGDLASLRGHWKAKVCASSTHTTQRSDMIASLMQMWTELGQTPRVGR
ncbi:hypothetical protein FRC03_001287 [Tulasnella sp. 419]|nr:hypothetical protein FRC03_001287 [Tulasnella sp. 419]